MIGDTTRLAKLTTARCEQVRDDLVNTHNRPTARKILTTFKAVVKDAKRRGMIAHNPASDTTIGAGKRHQKRLKAGEHFPEPGELKAMLASGDARGTAVVALAALAGLRASELRGLPWSDVDLGHEPSVTVRQRADRWGEIGSPKSADAARTVPLAETAKQALRAWKVAQPPVETKDEDGNKVTRPHVLVFGTASDRPDMLGNLQRRLLDPLPGQGRNRRRGRAAAVQLSCLAPLRDLVLARLWQRLEGVSDVGRPCDLVVDGRPLRPSDPARECARPHGRCGASPGRRRLVSGEALRTAG